MLYDVVTGDMFEIAILTVIICNMVMMMIQHYGQSAQVSSALHILCITPCTMHVIFISKYTKKPWKP